MTKLCRKGLHDLTLPGAIVSYPSDHPRCRKCREVTDSAAKGRYAGTLKDLLRQLRWHSGQTGAQLEAQDGVL